LITNKTQVQIEKKKGNYAIEYSLASASEGGAAIMAGGPSLKMEFPHVQFSTVTTACMTVCMQAYKVVIVPEELKEKTKAAMLSPLTCHIYSIQNCQLKASGAD